MSYLVESITKIDCSVLTHHQSDIALLKYAVTNKEGSKAFNAVKSKAGQSDGKGPKQGKRLPAQHNESWSAPYLRRHEVSKGFIAVNVATIHLPQPAKRSLSNLTLAQTSLPPPSSQTLEKSKQFALKIGKKSGDSAPITAKPVKPKDGKVGGREARQGKRLKAQPNESWKAHFFKHKVSNASIARRKCI